MLRASPAVFGSRQVVIYIEMNMHFCSYAVHLFAKNNILGLSVLSSCMWEAVDGWASFSRAMRAGLEGHEGSVWTHPTKKCATIKARCGPDGVMETSIFSEASDWHMKNLPNGRRNSNRSCVSCRCLSNSKHTMTMLRSLL